MNSDSTLWFVKYAPTTFDEYIGNDTIKSNFKRFIERDEIPNIIFYGTAGTGKTSLISLITKSLDCEVLEKEGSKLGVDGIRNEITAFAKSTSCYRWKIVILEEMHNLSFVAQTELLRIVEKNSDDTRFIFTTNWIEKIIEPLRSRCSAGTYKIEPMSEIQVAMYAKTILDKEKIIYNMADIVPVVKSCYPDIRRTLGTLSQMSASGTLVLSKQLLIDSNVYERLFELITTCKQIDVSTKQIRQLIADNSITQFEPLYNYLYDKLDVIANNGNKYLDVLITLGEAQWKHSTAPNKEMNFVSHISQILKAVK